MRDLISELEDFNNGHKARSVDISIDNGYGATCWVVKLFNEKQTIIAEEVNMFELKTADGNIGGIPYWNGKNNSIVVFAVTDDDFTEWPGLRPTLQKALDIATAMGLLPLSKKENSVSSNNQT